MDDNADRHFWLITYQFIMNVGYHRLNNCIISIIFINWQIIDLVPGLGTIYAIYISCLFKLNIFSDND